jgi:hypothetical protein
MLEFNYGWRILKGRKLHTFVSLIGLKHVRLCYLAKKYCTKIFVHGLRNILLCLKGKVSRHGNIMEGPSN